jgi:hypothetical protein
MPLYRTYLFLTEHTVPPPNIRGRGWAFIFRNFQVIRDKKKILKNLPTANYRTLTSIVKEIKISKYRYKTVYSPELLIQARSRKKAQQVFHLLQASMALMSGDCSFDDRLVIPDHQDDFEDLATTPWLRDTANLNTTTTSHLLLACKIAVRLSLKKKWVHAAFKQLISQKIYSVGYMDLDPDNGKNFTIQGDPYLYVSMSQAIQASYSVLEDLKIEIRASKENPSKLRDRSWNPIVLNCLKDDLRKARIEPERSILWHIRNSRSLIERKFPLPAGEKYPWTSGSVRDREILLVDALHYASQLRSRVAAHATHRLSQRLTAYNVSNVQFLARIMLLETIGVTPIIGFETPSQKKKRVQRWALKRSVVH